MCCSLGMAPLVIDTLEEQQCLSNLTKSNWKGNYNYWTGATQQECRGSWSWCDPEGQKKIRPAKQFFVGGRAAGQQRQKRGLHSHEAGWGGNTDQRFLPDGQKLQ